MSVLAKATFPFSGLNLSAGSGLTELERWSGTAEAESELMRVPDKGVDFVNCVFDLVICIDWFDPQLEDEPVELVDNKGDPDALLKGVLYDLFCVDHELESVEYQL